MLLLEIWDELHAAKRGEHGYGGDVLEFYFYRLMPPSPLLGSNPQSHYLDDAFYDAACKLHALCRLFETRHNVRIETVGGDDINLLLDRTDINRHRIHLKVFNEED
jgi:hypothetical protein